MVKQRSWSLGTGESPGGRVVLLVVAGVAAFFALLYVVAGVHAGDRLPHNTTIAGVDVGGQDLREATATLDAALAPRLDRPITLAVNGKTRTIDPATAGLTFDAEGSIHAAGASGWSPARLWQWYVGSNDHDAVVYADDDAMDALIKRLNDSLGTPAVNGQVLFKRGQVKTTDPKVGHGLDPETTKDALMQAWLSPSGLADVSFTELQPDIDADDVTAAVDDFANAAISAPITLVFDKTPVRLTPTQFAPALSMVAKDGVLVPHLDAKQLKALVGNRLGSKGQPVNATVALVNGKPQVVPSKPGVTYTHSDVTDAFLSTVVKADDERRIVVPATVARPTFTTADAKALKITEKVSSFTTYFPYAAYRNTNLGRAAELIDGTVIKPGGVFSLNGIVGERTPENGFTKGFVIQDGVFIEAYGGSVSQMATTVYNAGYFAGMTDIEHRAHSLYIDRYPVGREATVVWGSLDMRWGNDTPYGVLVHVTVVPSTPSTSGSVTVSLYSTKYWDITTSASARYAYTQPKTRYITEGYCYPNSGYAGFQIDVTRYFHRHGSKTVDHSEVVHTTYQPSDTVVCGPKPEETPTEEPT